jgi:hypothetical protein
MAGKLNHPESKKGALPCPNESYWTYLDLYPGLEVVDGRWQDYLESKSYKLFRRLRKSGKLHPGLRGGVGSGPLESVELGGPSNWIIG